MSVNKVTGMRVDEIFDLVDKAKSRKDKIEVLKKYNNRAIRDVLKGAFDSSIEFNLPEGAPPYTPGSEISYPSSLMKQTKKFHYFVRKADTRVAQAKVEMIFIKILESIHPKEAEILVLMKDKNLDGKYKGLTKKLVQDVFPGLISQ